MFCNHCGKNIQEDANVCAYCGRSVGYRAVQRRLTRPRAGRKIAGVCAGFADYFDLDPTLVRLVWLVIVIFGGTGLLAYAIGWILIPEEPFALAAPASVPPNGYPVANN
jgi:phage shock protein C